MIKKANFLLLILLVWSNQVIHASQGDERQRRMAEQDQELDRLLIQAQEQRNIAERLYKKTTEQNEKLLAWVQKECEDTNKFYELIEQNKCDGDISHITQQQESKKEIIKTLMELQENARRRLQNAGSKQQLHDQQQKNHKIREQELKTQYNIDGKENILLYVSSNSRSNYYEQTIMPGLKKIYIHISPVSHSNEIVLHDAYHLRSTDRPDIFCTMENVTHSNSVCLYSWNDWSYNATISGHSNEIIIRHPWRKYTPWFSMTVVSAALLYYLFSK
jgi:hypothetical protein